MKLKLPNSVYSPEQLTGLALEVKTYAHWASQTAIKKQVTGKTYQVAPEITPAANELLSSWFSGKKSSTLQDFDQLLEALEHIKNDAPRVSITVAAPAPESLRQQLVGWCRDNVDPDVLVSFSFNSTLLGGVVIRCGSRIFDWSFRKQILDNRATFPEILKHV